MENHTQQQLDNSLLLAARINDTTAIINSLEKGALLTATGSVLTADPGWSALHWVVWHGNFESVAFILKEDKHKEYFKCETTRGQTAIDILISCKMKLQEGVFRKIIVHFLHAFIRIKENFKDEYFDIFDNFSPLTKQDILFVLIVECEIKIINDFFNSEELLSARDINHNTVMHIAAQNGHINVLQLLYEKTQGLPAEKNTQGNIPLQIAVIHDQLKVSEWFYQNYVDDWSCDLDCKNKEGDTLLHLSARYNCRDIAEWILARGADITKKNNSQYTPLQYAVLWNCLDTLKLLLDYSTNLDFYEEEVVNSLKIAKKQGCSKISEYIENYPLILAVKNGDITAQEHLISNKSPIELSEIVDSFGNNLLHIAIINKHGSLVTQLSKKISVTTANKQGKTVFNLAAEIGDKSILSTLCNILKDFKSIKLKEEKDEIFRKKDFEGNSPLHIAARQGHENLIRFLTIEGDFLCDIKEVNNFDETPICLAAKEGHYKTVIEFLRFADIDTIVRTFHVACSYDRIRIIELLLEQSEDADIFNSKKDEPLIIKIIRSNKLNVLKYLVEEYRGNNFRKIMEQKINFNGRSYFPIHYAAELGRSHFIDYFGEQKIDLNVVDNKNNTALYYAIYFQKIKAIRQLLRLNVELKYVLEKSDLQEIYAKNRNIEILVKHHVEQNNAIQMFKKSDLENVAFSYKNLVFEGGGMKGIAYLGAIEQLVRKDNYFLKNIERVAGASVGAITALIIGLGYTVQDAKRLLDQINFSLFLDSDHKDFILKIIEIGLGAAGPQNWRNIISAYSTCKEHFGLFPGEDIYKQIKGWIHSKTKNGNITFKELHERKISTKSDFKDIYFIGTNATTQCSEIFSYEHTPDVIIADAIRISISIPIFFQPWYLYGKNGKNLRCKISNDIYIDGGVLDNYPVWIFDKTKYLSEFYGRKALDNKVNALIYNPETLGMRLMRFCEGEQENSSYTNKEGKELNFKSYIIDIISCFYNKQNNDHIHSDDKKRTIYIDPNGISTLSFDLDHKEKTNLINAGKVAVDEFYDRDEKKDIEYSLSPGPLSFLITLCTKYHVSFGKWGFEIKDLSLLIETPLQVYTLFKKIPDDKDNDIIVLKKLGINVDIKSREGETAMHLAIKDGDISCIGKLSAAGSNIKKMDLTLDICNPEELRNQYTVLDIISFLLKNNVLKTKNFEKIIPYIIQLLLKYEIDIRIVFAFFEFHGKNIRNFYEKELENRNRKYTLHHMEPRPLSIQEQCYMLLECIKSLNLSAPAFSSSAIENQPFERLFQSDFLKITDVTDENIETKTLFIEGSKKAVTLEKPIKCVTNDFLHLTENQTNKLLAPLNRKSLSSISEDNLKTLLKLPDSFIPGTAVDDGGCFFDGLAQILNSIQNTKNHTEESLRKICYNFWTKNKEKINQLHNKDYGGIDKIDDYRFVQYTKSELDTRFGGRAPIWGRQDVEGVILCDALNLPAIYIIELLKNPKSNQFIPNYITVTKEGCKKGNKKDILSYEKNIPTLVVGQTDLHFIPILRKKDKPDVIVDDKPLQTLKEFGIDSFEEHEDNAKVTLVNFDDEIESAADTLTQSIHQSYDKQPVIEDAKKNDDASIANFPTSNAATTSDWKTNFNEATEVYKNAKKALFVENPSKTRVTFLFKNANKQNASIFAQIPDSVPEKAKVQRRLNKMQEPDGDYAPSKIPGLCG